MADDSKKKSKEKQSGLHSIKIRVILLVVGIMAFILVALVFNTFISINRRMGIMTENHAYDLVTTFGKIIDGDAADAGKEILTTEYFERKVAGVGMKDVSTSYMYVTDKAGTIVYHPDPSKLGTETENSVLQELIMKLQAGESGGAGVGVYNYRGVNKYVAYYVSDSYDYIIALGCDKLDAMQHMLEIQKNVGLAAIAVIIICIVVAYIFASMIANPLEKMVGVVEVISDFDLRDKKILTKYSRKRDEVGRISRALMDMREKLVDTVRALRNESNTLYVESDKLNDKAVKVNELTGEVGESIDEIAQGAGSQAQDTQTTTEQVVVIGKMIEDTYTEIKNLNNSTSDIKAAGDKAVETLEDLDAVNVQAREAIEIIYRQTNNTNASAKKIREAVALITSIAEETNLLSLNASIEAARAGEQGKGFAVVASQIQKLAEQSNESSKDITEVVNVLIDDAKTAVETMEQVKEIMDKQNADVLRTNDMFNKVNIGINNSINSVKQIAESSKRLDEARAGMVDGLQNLSAIAEENAARTEETTASIAEINGVMDGISESTGSLKVVADRLAANMKMFKTE